MSVGGLFVTARAGYGVAYYGGILYFIFAVLLVFFLIKSSYDNTKEIAASDEIRKYFDKTTAFLKPLAARTSAGQIVVRKIDASDLRDALVRGFSDYRVQPTHLIILCVMYPVVGLFLARLTFEYDVLPLLFPLISGFALIGPLAATGLYVLSRRREQGLDMSWWHVFDVLRSPSIRAIVTLGLIMAGIFVAWLFAAQEIYRSNFGLWAPVSVSDFVHQVFGTSSGWNLILVGCGVGFLFAVFVMTISVVALPMLLDRNVGVVTAVRTSIQAVLTNPGAMAIWGLIVVGALVIGALPFFIGLAFVLPVFGHATWHLYRKLVERQPD
jgi:uncharacterized membrane protein